jgi:hypothetical protein
MLEYIHELPTGFQRDGVTHAQLGGQMKGEVTISGSNVKAQVTYGTVNENGTFQRDDLSGTHMLSVGDMQTFLSSPSDLDTLPETTEDLLLAAAQGLAVYADQNGLWHT